MSPEEACKIVCEQGDNSATCGERMNWVSEHTTNEEANACAAAQVMVVSDCPTECGGCTAAAAGCGAGYVDMIMKRYEEVLPEKEISQPLINRRAALAGAGGIVMLAGVAMIITAFVRGKRVERTNYSDVLLEDDPARNA